MDGPGEAFAIVWPGNGARHRSLHRIWLDSGASTKRLKHASEAVYYVARGTVTVIDGSTERKAREGAMVFVEPDTPYVFEAGNESVELIGGPCPPDPALYDGTRA
ncbi:MAG: cupin domain-containing protein [Actinomycetota bacterium]